MKRFIFALTTMVLSAMSFAQVAPISQWQCDMMKKNNVLSSGAPVGCDRLFKVDFDFINFKGETQPGNMIVLDVVAPAVEQIFSDLKQRNFPLHTARLMREFKGDDYASMEANNSSAFNARPITGGGGWSKHAYGVAIDINPVQNPFLAFDSNGRITVKPSQSATRYVNRTRFRARDEMERQGMAEEVVELFAHHGFLIWGGDWNTPIDTQHFEVGSRTFINQLLALPQANGKALFDQYIESYRQCYLQNRSDSPNITAGGEKARAICARKTVAMF
ncbi:M15 family metallopeptidase [uncultured Vibrio sp.]|uniref:M15 family metallopeptidase n=1 Tax=uncultured Vibrio sp. TaxID=114054 RepID=UPI002634270B|nr:M15 family metallopeptidase [uncultured Vibrio sp.]